MVEWRIFGETVWRASDFTLLLWVRCYPSVERSFALRWPIELGYGFEQMWTDVLEEIEFRGLLPITGWSQWYSEASHG